MERSYRIHTNVIKDTLINVDMKQDFDFLEVLSLKLRQKDAYRLHSSNYGVIVGRVLANDAFGIPNAKVSVFIERDISDSNEISSVYPYSEVMSKDSHSIRYNLLPDYSDDDCYRIVGTFPRKRYVLDDNVQLEVYDKYWKYSTVTNQAGDYMIFGVPSGSQQIHTDIDLSDIGILSQRPRDFVFKGYDINEFDSPSQFKESTNLDGLQQIISQNKTTLVYPFWGDSDNGIAALTRCDIQVNYKFEPTCVFMGAIVSDNEGNSIGHRCSPAEDSGMNDQLVAGEGTIEMIRKTVDGLVEEYPINGNALIDSDGVWCYQIPMNLDFIGTDEYGNIAPTDNPSKGIPTRAQVRFRFSKIENGGEGFSRHTAKYLVPMNPIMDEAKVTPTTQASTGIEMEAMYNFGSNTPQSCFRDLYWNNVYSVKNYIPKVQVAHRAYAPNYGALKGGNLVKNQNPIPFNKLQIDIPFTYMIVCIVFSIVMIVVSVINTIIYALQYLKDICIPVIIGELCPFFFIPKMACIPLNAGLGDGSNVAYFPGCYCDDSAACRNADCPEDMTDGCIKRSNNDELEDKIQQALALDYKVVRLDFYQDWLNGTLYMPLWFWRKRKKKKFLGFTISEAKNEYCSCDNEYSRLKTYVTCDINYNDYSLGTDDSNLPENEDRWHKTMRNWVRYKNGLIKGVENKDGLTAYYYAAFQATTDDPIQTNIKKRTNQFLFARLYATDIILLGNLNENNIYGIPQFFKALPSTTANIPPIATIQESVVDNLNDDDADTVSDNGDSGITITTGMDWGHDGDEQTPLYKNGLFIDLACTYAGTRAKSCINVERLSELGVNLDTTYEMSYSDSVNGIKKGMMDSDGFINKLELDDLDNRATFATLNHIGFIPQDYQDLIDGYTTQVIDENTGYFIPKFKYIYPVDFDGRLEPIMKRYKTGFEQALYDEMDESYITFRLGAEKSDIKDKNLEGRIRHFYLHDYNWGGRKRQSMPLYNNSFYFYFGINKGNTAIEKFNKMFYSPCFQKSKAPFSFTIDSMGKTYCLSTYENEFAYNGYAFIRFTSDDIVPPFSYTLYDSYSNTVVSEDDMYTTDFVIGGVIDDNGKIVMNENGIVKYQIEDEVDNVTKPVENVYGISGLTNQIYTLVITDANGRKISDRIELEIPKISLDFETEGLKTKFYSVESTRMDYICNDEYKLYGLIRLKDFVVDGTVHFITGAEAISYDAGSDEYKLRVTGQSVTYHGAELMAGDVVYADITVSVVNSDVSVNTRDCMCDSGNSIFDISGEETYIRYAESNPYWFGNMNPKEEEKNSVITNQIIPTLFVYQPNRFAITITQVCEVNGSFVEIAENTSSDIATVSNGEKLNAFLNTMPVKFMLGTTSDSKTGSIANQSYFYSTDVVTSPTLSNISGWYGLHQEDTYRWNMDDNKVLIENKDMWSDFVKINDEITSHNVKGKILEYKFKTMFSLASTSYVVDSNINTFTYNSVGGVPPTLFRVVAPKYSDTSAMRNQYVLSDSNRASGQANYPNIVGYNYMYSGMVDEIGDALDAGPQFNPYYSNGTEKMGNYFASFTENGGYTSRTQIDDSIHVISIPTNAKVTPRDGVKRLGQDENGIVSQFPYAYSKSRNGAYLPYLRALYVDRRLDYNLVLFAPCAMNQDMTIYKCASFDDSGNAVPSDVEKIWRSARISGVTYNGVEMSYDEDYKIVSADILYEYRNINDETESGRCIYDGNEYYVERNDTYQPFISEVGNLSSYTFTSLNVATTNKRLEYSYNYSDLNEDSVTYYNSEPDMIWEVDAVNMYLVDDFGNIVYNDEGKATLIKSGEKGQILKRLYDASFVGKDIRNYFWSDFNKKRLYQYASEQVSFTTSNYIYKYPYSHNEGEKKSLLYNGDFNRLNVITNLNYPTKRYIDIGNIQSDNSYDLVMSSCSYETNINYNGIVGMVDSDLASANEEIVSMSFENPVSLVMSIEGIVRNVGYNKEETFVVDSNCTYQKEGSAKKDGFNKFVVNNSSGVTMLFKISPVINNEFYVYTEAFPRIIKVYPLHSGSINLDGISYIKTSIPYDEEVVVDGETKTLVSKNVEDAINAVTLFDFFDEYHTQYTINDESSCAVVPLRTENGKWHYDDDNSMPDRDYFYRNESGNLIFYTSDSVEAQSITYVLRNKNFDDTTMFAICIERTYRSKTTSNLTKRVSVFEFSEVYDMRPLYMVLSNYNISTSNVKLVFSLCKLTKDNNDNPISSEEKSCEVAISSGTSYTLGFTPDPSNPEVYYELTSTSVSDIEQAPHGEKRDITFEWRAGTGEGDIPTVNEAKAEFKLFINTKGGFIYKIDNFKLSNVR